MNSLGHKLKTIREFKNFTQDYVSDKLGMSTAGYGKIERDEVDVPYSRLEQISKVFKMKIEDIISFDEKVVFNIMNNQIGIKDLNLNNSKLSDRERELYEKNIKLLEEKISFLEKLNEK